MNASPAGPVLARVTWRPFVAGDHPQEIDSVPMVAVELAPQLAFEPVHLCCQDVAFHHLGPKYPLADHFDRGIDDDSAVDGRLTCSHLGPLCGLLPVPQLAERLVPGARRPEVVDLFVRREPLLPLLAQPAQHRFSGEQVFLDRDRVLDRRPIRVDRCRGHESHRGCCKFETQNGVRHIIRVLARRHHLRAR